MSVDITLNRDEAEKRRASLVKIGCRIIRCAEELSPVRIRELSFDNTIPVYSNVFENVSCNETSTTIIFMRK